MVFNSMFDAVSKSVGSDINKLIHVLHSFSKYDFSVRVDGEDAEMEKDLNEMANVIVFMVSQNIHDADALAQTSEDLAEFTSKLVHTIEEQAVYL